MAQVETWVGLDIPHFNPPLPEGGPKQALEAQADQGPLPQGSFTEKLNGFKEIISAP